MTIPATRILDSVGNGARFDHPFLCRKAASQLTKIHWGFFETQSKKYYFGRIPNAHAFVCQAIKGETFGTFGALSCAKLLLSCPAGWFAVCKHASTVSFSKKFLE